MEASGLELSPFLPVATAFPSRRSLRGEWPHEGKKKGVLLELLDEVEDDD